jgi:predicted ATP-dependent endonuclease of OLD family
MIFERKGRKMIIQKIEIENFRNLDSCCVDINKNIILIESEINVLGPKNLGKTNFINAILWCFGKNSKFDRIKQTKNQNKYIFEDFTNKAIKEFKVSVTITYLDESKSLHKIQRLINYSYNELNKNSCQINDYYVTNECRINGEYYDFDEYVDKIKNLTLPIFLDDLRLYADLNFLEDFKKQLNETTNNQMFIVSYDNFYAKPIVGSVLSELGKDYQTITVGNNKS